MALDCFEYAIINNEVSILQCLDQNIEELEIPEHIDGYPVVKIERSAFYGLPFLRHVVLPTTLSIVESYAFEHCTSLEIVKCDAPNIEICNGAFRGCSNLRLFASEGTVYLRTAVFKNCKRLETICGRISGVARFTFANCSNLHNPLVFAKQVYRFHGDAFHNCENLTDIYLLGDIDVVDALNPETLTPICFHCVPSSNVLNWAYNGMRICVNET